MLDIGSEEVRQTHTNPCPQIFLRIASLSVLIPDGFLSVTLRTS